MPPKSKIPLFLAIYQKLILAFFGCSLGLNPNLAQEIPNPPALQGYDLQGERPFFKVRDALQTPELVLRLFAEELHDSPEEVFLTLKQLPNLRSLYLSGNLCQTLPAELLAKANQIEEIALLQNEEILWEQVAQQLKRFPKLQHLKIQLSPNQKLDPSLCQLKQLKQLSIIDCELDTLPPCFCQLKKLEVLDLRSSNLLYLGPEIQELRKLRALYLGPLDQAAPNPLSKLPNLNKLSKLEQLDLSFIQEIPTENLPKSKKLQWLNLQYCSKTPSAKLLNQIQNYTQLQYLNLNQTQVKSLSLKFLEQLPELRQLHLRHNKIQAFPSKIPNTKLEFIDLYDHELSTDNQNRLQKTLESQAIQYNW